jgi:hypothetical protein
MQRTKGNYLYPTSSSEVPSIQTCVVVLATHPCSERSNLSSENTWLRNVSKPSSSRQVSSSFSSPNVSLLFFSNSCFAENGAGPNAKDLVVPFNFDASGVERERVEGGEEGGEGCCAKSANPAADKIGEVTTDGQSDFFLFFSHDVLVRLLTERLSIHTQSRFREKRFSTLQHQRSIRPTQPSSEGPPRSTPKIKTRPHQPKSRPVRN